MSPTYPLVFKY